MRQSDKKLKASQTSSLRWSKDLGLVQCVTGARLCIKLPQDNLELWLVRAEPQRQQIPRPRSDWLNQSLSIVCHVNLDQAIINPHATSKMTRNLLICVDAFGTLFRPRQPIFKQYGDVARAHGMKSAFTDDQIANAFKNAFKDESKAHPNYGKAVNMGSYMWWTNVSRATVLFTAPRATNASA